MTVTEWSGAARSVRPTNVRDRTFVPGRPRRPAERYRDMTSIQHRPGPSSEGAGDHEQGDDSPQGEGGRPDGADDDRRSPSDRLSDGDEPSDRVDLDVVFDILKNRRRRLVLEFLAADAPTSLSDLSEQIAAVENDKPAAELSSQERKRVYVGLYQCHLPRMHESGAIEFDKNRGTVDPGPNVNQFYTYLERSEPDVTPWSVFYLALAAASLVAVTGALVLTESAATGIFASALLAFAMLVVVHLARTLS